jgi:hypothetical protein
MELNHLAVAEKAVLQGERHIEDEEQRIAELDRAIATIQNWRLPRWQPFDECRRNISRIAI